jgi:hypothetical protein
MPYQYTATEIDLRDYGSDKAQPLLHGTPTVRATRHRKPAPKGRPKTAVSASLAILHSEGNRHHNCSRPESLEVRETHKAIRGVF